MEKNIVNFEKYLNIERNYSNYTIKNYLIDITEFITYCNNFNKNYLNIKYTDIKSYLSFISNCLVIGNPYISLHHLLFYGMNRYSQVITNLL